MHRPPVEKGAAHDEVSMRRSWVLRVIGVRLLLRYMGQCRNMKLSIVESEHPTERRVTQLDRVRDDGLEHRLHIGWRAADNAQDLARRRQLALRPRHPA